MAIVQKKIKNSAAAIQPIFFSDFETDFLVDTRKNDIARLTNEESIKKSIRNLLLTNRGDRLFNNTLGSDMRSILFENPTPALDQILSDYIIKTIDNYEPRAAIISVIVNSEVDSGYVNATITFNVINKQEPVTLDLVLNRIR
jgi:phage baseplate assembly protein W